MECYYDYYLNMCICENYIVQYDVSTTIGMLFTLIYSGLKTNEKD